VKTLLTYLDSSGENDYRNAKTKYGKEKLEDNMPSSDSATLFNG